MNDNSSGAAAAGMIAGFALVYGVVILAILAFTVWVYWRIFQKAGYNGALSLINLIPGGALVTMCILAFGRWPIQDELDASRAGNATPRMTPGSSVMPTP
jgi:hypothetical protein